jgi:hypothetical protein
VDLTYFELRGSFWENQEGGRRRDGVDCDATTEFGIFRLEKKEMRANVEENRREEIKETLPGREKRKGNSLME